ncbi:hypothetical protein M3Y99_00035400 [Aphelenchoides fujianensis]|nr:hypothetical protein M3Y99_00035400 [Aphelenchoides fujianensis]
MFDGKVVIVTGSSSGIGLETRRAFRAKGSGRRSARAEAEERMSKKKIPAERILVVRGDVCDPKTQKELVDGAIKRFGRLDVLVSEQRGDDHEERGRSLSRWKPFEFLFDVNLKRRRRGTVVNISAAVAQRAALSMHFYSLTKAALDQFSRSAALLLAPKGIRVNSVSPGLTATNFARRHATFRSAAERGAKFFTSIIPLGRAAEGREVAEVVVFVASPASSYITGSVIPVGWRRSGRLPPPADRNRPLVEGTHCSRPFFDEFDSMDTPSSAISSLSA